MDWNLVALIAYVFALLFLLAYMIMRSYRGTKKRYARLLEEREQKLSRMQIDIEETMDGLESYADEVRNEWSGFRSKERESFAAIQEQGLKMAATLVELKGELNVVRTKQRELERRIEELSAGQVPCVTGEGKVAIPDAGERSFAVQSTGVIPQAEVMPPKTMISPRSTQAGTRRLADEAKQLLLDGVSIEETASRLSMSRGEVEFLARKLAREKKR